MKIALNGHLRQLLILLCSLCLTGCFVSEDKKPEKFIGMEEIQELKGDVFGSYYLIKFRGALDVEKFRSELAQFFKDFNGEFSTYQPDSMVSQFNVLPKNQKLKVNARFIEMLEFCKSMNEKTRGAFDPTLRPVIRAWGFGGAKRSGPPSAAEVKEALAKVGMSKIKWDASTLEVWKVVDGVEIDTNAFVPGWASDIIGTMLESYKVTNYMIDVGGEILVKGEKRTGKSWILGIEKPAEDLSQNVQVVVAIKDSALATSGNYRQFYDDQGKRRSHIIDPRTGRPVEHSISSASVIAPAARDADAWSTAMMVLGEKGLELANQHGLAVSLLKAKGPGKFEELNTDSMSKLINETEL